jgi:hypothetical protein
MCENGLLDAELMLHKIVQREKTNVAPFMIGPFLHIAFRRAPVLGRDRYCKAALSWGIRLALHHPFHIALARRNPDGYFPAAGGIVLSSVCALGWAVALRSRPDESKAQRPSGLSLLIAGSVCMAASVLLPWRLPRLPKEHEILTLFAFRGLCLGMIRLAFQTAERVLRRRAGGSARRLRLYGAARPRCGPDLCSWAC